MNFSRLAVAVAVGTVVYFAWGFLIEGWLIRDHFALSHTLYRNASEMRKYMPAGLLSTVLAIFVMAVIYAKIYAVEVPVSSPISTGAFFGLLFGIFAACIHSISNYVTMNMDLRLGIETTASCLIGWVLVGVAIALLYQPILR